MQINKYRIKQIDDIIPDKPENKKAREQYIKASEGWIHPFGDIIRVMKCYKCHAYGHCSRDKECPLFLKGNEKTELFNKKIEDPMFYKEDRKKRKKYI